MNLLKRWHASARKWFIDECTRLLTKPLRSYEVRIPNNLERLRQTLRKGDVLLVEGDQRVSQVIRYLTQSCWSHSALYIGDELLKPEYRLAEELRGRYGVEAGHLLIEAVQGSGVIASPIGKYMNYNIRICRPRLEKEDVNVVMREVIKHLGDRYDLKHIIDLCRYFFPVSLVPRRWRRVVLRLGSGSEHAVICSSMIAKAFAKVGYPILPREVKFEEYPPSRWWKKLPFRNGKRLRVRFRMQDPAIVTPRDFDLSPYFEVIKFNHLHSADFHYRDIEWDAEDLATGSDAAASA